jgi:hypothetical protein
MSDTPPERESRACAKCGVTDTHAHHVQYVAFVHPVTGEGTDLSVSKHIQCCAEDGCPICTVDVDQAAQTLTDTAPSDEFTALMQTKGSEHLQVLFDTVGVESPEFQTTATEA